MQPSSEQTLHAYNSLPQPVRAYLASTELYDSMAIISTKYGLHVDVVGMLSKSVTQMLLGFIDPSQLMQEMRRIGIDGSKSIEIAKELNQLVFKPLHQKMREGKEAVKQGPSAPLVDVPAPLGYSNNGSVVPTVQSDTSPLPAYSAPVQPSEPKQFNAPTPQIVQKPIPRNYGSDPYREPIE